MQVGIFKLAVYLYEIYLKKNLFTYRICLVVINNYHSNHTHPHNHIHIHTITIHKHTHTLITNTPTKAHTHQHDHKQPHNYIVHSFSHNREGYNKFPPTTN
uniref:Uncharacterized protein n=1 Tax=Cacopsylla melanoneura TaxID=428564 RepID=A0A8D8TGZ2_9HEMI